MYGAVRVLSVFHISRYALGHVVLDVVVKECVVAVVEACRAEELGQCDGVGFGVCHDYAALRVDLRIRADVADADRAGIHVYQERPRVFARRSVFVIEFPVQRIDADGALGSWYYSVKSRKGRIK